MCSQGPVAAELSGGVDSSCIVGMCQSLFHGGSVPNLGFETLSLVFPDLPCDETSYLRQMVALWNLSSNEVPVLPDPEWYPECASRYLDLPDHPNCHMSISQRPCAAERLSRESSPASAATIGSTRRSNSPEPGAPYAGCAPSQPCRPAPCWVTAYACSAAGSGSLPDHTAPWIPMPSPAAPALADRVRRAAPGRLFCLPVQKKLYVRLTNATLIHFSR